jgi:hypothetical protein
MFGSHEHPPKERTIRKVLGGVGWGGETKKGSRKGKRQKFMQRGNQRKMTLNSANNSCTSRQWKNYVS